MPFGFRLLEHGPSVTIDRQNVYSGLGGARMRLRQSGN
jgi:hypothetical protein